MKKVKNVKNKKRGRPQKRLEKRHQVQIRISQLEGQQLAEIAESYECFHGSSVSVSKLMQKIGRGELFVVPELPPKRKN